MQFSSFSCDKRLEKGADDISHLKHFPNQKVYVYRTWLDAYLRKNHMNNTAVRLCYKIRQICVKKIMIQQVIQLVKGTIKVLSSFFKETLSNKFHTKLDIS